MKKKIEMKKKFTMCAVGIATVACIIVPTKASAALQANKNPGNTDTIESWLLNVRKMESTGGTLGLSDDTIDVTNLTSTMKNNLDIHVQKNTEYGAMAILSASAYGNQKKINDGETTTGNKTGIYMKLNIWEATAAFNINTILPYANSKYKQKYASMNDGKCGDAFVETRGWHNSKAVDTTSLSEWVIFRSGNESIFDWGNMQTGRNHGTTRACIVVGNEF